MYLPLYNENIGLGGFKCKTCPRVTRTERGMRSHCWRCHGQKQQTDFDFGPAAAEPVRTSGGGAEQSATSGESGVEGNTGSDSRASSAKDTALS
jgi:hypothetical protein